MILDLLPGLVHDMPPPISQTSQRRARPFDGQCPDRMLIKIPLHLICGDLSDCGAPRMSSLPRSTSIIWHCAFQYGDSWFDQPVHSASPGSRRALASLTIMTVTPQIVILQFDESLLWLDDLVRQLITDCSQQHQCSVIAECAERVSIHDFIVTPCAPTVQPPIQFSTCIPDCGE